jgi:hypothetical protein
MSVDMVRINKRRDPPLSPTLLTTFQVVDSSVSQAEIIPRIEISRLRLFYVVIVVGGRGQSIRILTFPRLYINAETRLDWLN